MGSLVLISRVAAIIFLLMPYGGLNAQKCRAVTSYFTLGDKTESISDDNVEYLKSQTTSAESLLQKKEVHDLVSDCGRQIVRYDPEVLYFRISKYSQINTSRRSFTIITSDDERKRDGLSIMPYIRGYKAIASAMVEPGDRKAINRKYIGLWSNSYGSILATFMDNPQKRWTMMATSKYVFSSISYYPAPDALIGSIGLSAEGREGTKLLRYTWVHHDWRWN